MSTRRPTLLAALAMAATLALGACSSDDDGGDEPSGAEDGGGDGSDGGTSATQPPAADEGACGILTPDEVGGLFGTDATAAPPPGPPVTCLWEADDDDGFPTHQLQVSLYEGGEPVDPSSYGERAEPVEGVGDEAFVVADGVLGTTAAARTGETSVVLTYAVLTDGGGDAAAGQADEVVDLLRSATERANG